MAKEYVVIMGEEDLEQPFEIWERSEYDSYVRMATDVGATPAVTLITEFNKNDRLVAIPITQRTYSLQDLLEAWELGGSSAYNCVNPATSCDFDSDKHKKDKQQYFKLFGIEIK